MKAICPAKFILDDNGEYSVIFPDLDGCVTCGDNLERALEMAQEAMGLYLVALEEHRHEMPAASALMVTIPAWLKEAAEKAHVSFSGILQEALKQKLGY